MATNPTSYPIRTAAAACGLTVHTLRWYERIGLLDRVPRGVDGRRRFGESDLDWLRFLVRLRGTGMPVAEMLRYAELARSGDESGERRLALLLAHRERVAANIAALKEHLEAVDYKIGIYRRTVRRQEEIA